MAASKDYYDANPRAKARKNAYMKEYMKTDTAIRIRQRADNANAKLKKEGKGGKVGDGKDYSHHHGRLVDAGTHRSGDKERKPNTGKLKIPIKVHHV